MSTLALNDEDTRRVLLRGLAIFDAVLEEAVTSSQDTEQKSELRPTLLAVLR